jgi:hypothetical protein
MDTVLSQVVCSAREKQPVARRQDFGLPSRAEQGDIETKEEEPNNGDYQEAKAG